MTTDTTQATRAPQVQFARRSTRGFWGAARGSQVLLIAVACAFAIPAQAFGGVWMALLTGPVWVTAVAVAFIPWNGEPASEVLPYWAHFRFRQLRRQTVAVRDVSAPVKVGSLRLFGDAERMQYLEVGGVAMQYDPHMRELSAAGVITQPAYVLLDDDEKHRRTGAWGRLLASLAGMNTYARSQVLLSSWPDSGRGVREFWLENRVPDAPDLGTAQYAGLMERHAPAAATHEGVFVIALSMDAAAQKIRDVGGGLNGAAVLLQERMVAMKQTLREAGLNLETWMTTEQLARTIHTAFDPTGAARLEGSSLGLNPSTAGPMGVTDYPDYLQTAPDAFHRVLEVTELPRSEVAANFLHALVFLQGVTKTVSFTFTPIPPREAEAAILGELTHLDADARGREKAGRTVEQKDANMAAAARAQEAAVNMGHALNDFVVTITVTSKNKADLDSDTAKVHECLLGVGCAAETMLFQQSSAFHAARLPFARKI